MSCDRIIKVDSLGNQTVVAGNGITGFSGDGGPATSARLFRPHSIALDAAGNLYIYDGLNFRIRKVDHTTGFITTIAGTGLPAFNGDNIPATTANIGGGASSLFADAAGDVFIADTPNDRVREVVAATGNIITVAGTGARGFNGDGIPATTAKLNRPVGVFVDSLGDIFIVDELNQRIRMVDPSGTIHTVAGTGLQGFNGDGIPATTANLSLPASVFGDSSGNIFIGELSGGRVRVVANAASGTGTINTVTMVVGPEAISLDGSGDIFIVQGVSAILEVVKATGIVQTFATDGADGDSGDGGPATSARVAPFDAVADGAGNIFIADGNAGKIREKVAATGDIKTVAGGGALSSCAFPLTEVCIGNGGPALAAVMRPQALAVDGLGNIFVADANSAEVRKFTVGGNIQSVAGSAALGLGDSGDGGTATSAQLFCPTGVALDTAGNIFIADNCNNNIREVIKATGNITTVAGDPTGMNSGYNGDNRPATTASLNSPFGVWVDASDNIFVTDALNNRIREVVAATGLIETVAGNGTEGVSGDGGLATAAQISRGASLLRGDTHGNIFYADFFGNTIREFRVGGNIETVAGNQVEGPSPAVPFVGDGLLPTNAELNSPNSVFADAGDRLLIADSYNFRVRQVTFKPTTTSLSSSPNPSVVNQSLTLTATVTSTSGSPTGTVTFFATSPSIGPTVFTLGTAVVTNGTATLVTGPTNTPTQPGTYSGTAEYSGDSTFAGSTSAAHIQTVTGNSTTTSVTSSRNPSMLGQAVTFTATVMSGGSITPTGTVTFLDNGVPIGSPVPLNASAVATFTTSSLTQGTHNIRADYSGAAGFGSSRSPKLIQLVESTGTTPTSTALSSSPNPSAINQSLTLTATVTTGSGTPTGTVAFIAFNATTGTQSGTAVLNAQGIATFVSPPVLVAGTYSIKAVYLGDSTFAASTSNVVTQIINGNSTSTTTSLTSSLNPALVGQSVTFTATVTATLGTAVGTVNFTNNGVLMGSATLNASGMATFTRVFGGVGSHAIVATYSGNAAFGGSISATLTQVVNPLPATTTTTVVSSLNPSIFGQAVTFTARVTGTAPGTPTGMVTFVDTFGGGQGPLGEAVLSNGQATFTISDLAPGSHSLLASYSGDANFLGSNSAGIAQTVKSATTTALISSLNPAFVGQPVTFTATVTAGVGTPTGTVNFTNNGVLMGSATLNASGIATFTRVFGGVGSHAIVATYSGTAAFGGSISATLTQVVNPLPATTTALISSLNPSLVGQTVTFTATVASGAGTPTGTVNFTNNGILMGSATLNASGIATFTRVFGGVGAHTIVAQYGGAATFAASTSVALTQTVRLVPTTTALISSLNPALVGQSVTFTATVTAALGTAAGTVNFTNNGVLMGTATLNASGVATFTRVFGGVGSHAIVATYSGSAAFTGSISATLTQVVNPLPATTTALISSPNPAFVGQSVTFTATVASGGGTPTGTVNFTNNGILMGSATLNGSGVATFTKSFGGVGAHTIVAQYGGAATFAASTSVALTQTVRLVPTTTALISSLNPSLVGQSVTFTATVTATLGTAAGTVNFTNNGILMGSATLNASGVATFNRAFGGVGSHAIVATYSGTAAFGGSISATLTQVVNPLPATTTALISSPNPAFVGQPVTFTAMVASGGGTPTGTVNFTNNGILMGSATLNASGIATFTRVFGGVGAHTIVAQYGVAATFAASTSTALTQTVRLVPTTTALISSLNPSLVGQSVTFTATVTATLGTAAGTVNFTNNGVLMGSATLNASGVATFTRVFGGVGSHAIVATYSGSAAFTGSISATLTQVVNPLATATALTSSPNPWPVGELVTFTATVASDASTPGGIVTFTNNGVSMGAATLVGGVAILPEAFGAAGTHVITAIYSANGDFAGSTSATLNQVITP